MLYDQASGALSQELLYTQLHKVFSYKLTLVARCPAANLTHQHRPNIRAGSILLERTSRSNQTRGKLCDSEKVHSLSRLFEKTRWTFAFALVANANFRVSMISAYLANAWVIQIKIKVEPSLSQRITVMLACWKTMMTKGVNSFIGVISHWNIVNWRRQLLKKLRSS